MAVTYDVGDLWDYYSRGYALVVTTNLGWKKDGSNVMGAGIAKQAAKRFIDLPVRYGALCKERAGDEFVVYFPRYNLILFPSKPLNHEQPWMSWRGSADIDLIERCLVRLKRIIEKRPSQFKVAMPYPGCGNGGLEVEQVAPLIEEKLGNVQREVVVVNYR